MIVPSGMTLALFLGWVHQATCSASVSPIVFPASFGPKKQKSSMELIETKRASDDWLTSVPMVGAGGLVTPIAVGC